MKFYVMSLKSFYKIKHSKWKYTFTILLWRFYVKFNIELQYMAYSFMIMIYVLVATYTPYYYLLTTLNFFYYLPNKVTILSNLQYLLLQFYYNLKLFRPAGLPLMAGRVCLEFPVGCPLQTLQILFYIDGI